MEWLLQMEITAHVYLRSRFAPSSYATYQM